MCISLLTEKFEFSAGEKRINNPTYTNQNFNSDNFTKSQSAK
jgi:hypothetical protein